MSRAARESIKLVFDTIRDIWGLRGNNTGTRSISEIIVDDVDAVFAGSWGSSSSQDGYIGTGYRYNSPGTGADTATWTITVPETGSYEVYARWSVAGSNRASDAPYTVYYDGGSATGDMDQRVNGGEWVSLGVYSFEAGPASVALSDDADGYVIADAIRFILEE